jgi:16S rRNA (uracil1498-N3)-methyltransferase
MTQAHAFLFSKFEASRGTELFEDALPSGLARHLKALRVGSHEKVSFLNGSGIIADAICLSTKPYVFRVEKVTTHKAPQPRVHLFLSPPRRDTLSQTLSQATEMGVSEIHFLASAHNDYSQKERVPLVERSQRVLEAAIEQCRSPYLPVLDDQWSEPRQALDSFAGPLFFADEDLSRRGIYGCPEASPSITNASDIGLFIGPEGGWSPAERELFIPSSRLFSLGLGPQILKVPTACVAALYQLHLFARNVVQP